MDESTTSGTGRYTIDAVDTAISILMIIAAEPGLGLSEIGRRAGQSKARVFRLIKTLQGRGLLAQSATDRTYRLGYTALVVGGAAARQIDLVQIGRPILASLGQAVGETAQLRIREGTQAMCIAAWEPPRELKVNALIGRRRPLHRGTNKILLAFSEEDFQNSVLARLAGVEERGAMVDLKVLRSRLAKVRRDGYEVSRGEVNKDLVGIGSPIFGPDGRIIAAVNISAPANRMQKKHLKPTVAAVVEAARQFSALLGS